MSICYQAQRSSDTLRPWSDPQFVLTVAPEKALPLGSLIIESDGHAKDVAKIWVLSPIGRKVRDRVYLRAKGGKRSLRHPFWFGRSGDAVRRVHPCGDLCGAEGRMGSVEGNSLLWADRADATDLYCVGYGGCFALASWPQYFSSRLGAQNTWVRSGSLCRHTKLRVICGKHSTYRDPGETSDHNLSPFRDFHSRLCNFLHLFGDEEHVLWAG